MDNDFTTDCFKPVAWKLFVIPEQKRFEGDNVHDQTNRLRYPDTPVCL